MSAPESPNHFRDFLRDVDRYWFGCGSPVALGVLRIVTGLLACADLLVLGFHYEDWFTEKGYVPKSLSQMWFDGNPYVWYPDFLGHHFPDAPVWRGGLVVPKINLFYAIDSPLWQLVLFWGIFVAAILTAFGLWTRISTFVLAMGIVSINHRTPLILMGGDTVLRVGCLYLMLSPCGTVCSVDRLIALWKGRIQPGPVSVSLWVQRLITYNVALLYLTSVWLKWYGAHWHAGTSVYFSNNLPEFFRFPYPHFLITPPFGYLLTWGTMATEFSMATLVFIRPVRNYVLIAGVMLHMGIEYTMNVPLFGYLMISWYICFFDGEEITAFFRSLGKRLHRFGVTVHIPAGQSLRPNSLAVLKAVDPLGLVRYVQGEQDSLYVTRADGRSASGAWSVISRCLGAWPFLGLPWIWGPFLTRSLES